LTEVRCDGRRRRRTEGTHERKEDVRKKATNLEVLGKAFKEKASPSQGDKRWNQ